jgi:hypothetical protein
MLRSASAVCFFRRAAKIPSTVWDALREVNPRGDRSRLKVGRCWLTKRSGSAPAYVWGRAGRARTLLEPWGLAAAQPLALLRELIC